MNLKPVLDYFAEQILKRNPRVLNLIYGSTLCPFVTCPLEEENPELQECDPFKCWQYAIDEDEVEEDEIAFLEEMFLDENLKEEGEADEEEGN